MIWNIVTDSSCDLHKLSFSNDTDTVRYTSVPFIISVGNRDFVDDDDLDLEEMLTVMEHDQKASRSACPSPDAFLQAFRQEGHVICVTISSNLSGSYNSACIARDMVLEEFPDKKVAVINSVSAGTGLNVIVRCLLHSIQSGASFEDTVSLAQKITDLKKTIFALCSFDNLVKNGRMPRLVGFVARKLGFWGIGIGSPEGTIVIKDKVRGAKKALTVIIEDMKERGIPTDCVIISHCQNPELAETLKQEVLKLWNDIQVEIHNTKGLCSYYAERHGLIVGYR